GHVFVSTIGAGVIWDVDPVAKTKSAFVSVAADGLSTDGTTLYADPATHILGFNIATHALVFDSGFIAGGADGTALGTGSLAGKIYANTNGGTVVEIDLIT